MKEFSGFEEAISLLESYEKTLKVVHQQGVVVNVMTRQDKDKIKWNTNMIELYCKAALYEVLKE